MLSNNQASIKELTPTSDCSSMVPPAVRLVKIAVIPSFLRKSITRVNIPLISSSLPTAVRLVIGSMMSASGRNSVTILCKTTKWFSSPYKVGRIE